MGRRVWAVLAAAVLVTAVGCSGKKSHRTSNTTTTTKSTSKPSANSATNSAAATPSASSSTYRPKESPLLTGCVSVQSGKTCEFHGAKFKPGEQVVLTRTGSGAPFSQVETADAQGRFTDRVTLTFTPDSYVFTARGKDSGGSATATVQVRPAS